MRSIREAVHLPPLLLFVRQVLSNFDELLKEFDNKRREFSLGHEHTSLYPSENLFSSLLIFPLLASSLLLSNSLLLLSAVLFVALFLSRSLSLFHARNVFFEQLSFTRPLYGIISSPRGCHLSRYGERTPSN